MEERTSWTDRPSRDPWQLLCKLASEMSLSSFPGSGGHSALSKLEAAMRGAVKWEGGTPPWRQGAWPGRRFQSLGAWCGSKTEAGWTLSWGLYAVPLTLQRARRHPGRWTSSPRAPGRNGVLGPHPRPRESETEVVQPAGCVSASPPASVRHTQLCAPLGHAQVTFRCRSLSFCFI